MHILTFDVEEWFHVFTGKRFQYPENWHHFHAMLPAITEKILQLLSENHAHATFFCLGWVANRYPQMIRQIQREGHEIAAHSYWHKQVHKQTLKAFREDLKDNVSELESITGNKVVSYRAPAFTYGPFEGFWSDALLEAGIKVDGSVKSGIKFNNTYIPNHPFRLSNNDDGLIYCPISTASFFHLQIPYAGSGYFRLLPFAYIQHKLKQPGYHMLYFHPRDLDPLISSQAAFALQERLRFFPGTKNALPRLEALLNRHTMSSIRESLPEIRENLLSL